MVPVRFFCSGTQHCSIPQCGGCTCHGAISCIMFTRTLRSCITCNVHGHSAPHTVIHACKYALHCTHMFTHTRIMLHRHGHLVGTSSYQEQEPHVRGAGAFESPQTLAGFTDFLRQTGERLEALAVMAIVPKPSMGYPTVSATQPHISLRTRFCSIQA